MANFDEILNELHDDSVLSDKDVENGYITIDESRNFKLPENYNTVLAYSGDINSQIVTFQLPENHEGHNLRACQYKKLKWKNLTSGLEGVSNLILVDDGLFKWEVPPEAFTQAGTLAISISLYDIKNNEIAFSWNTPPYTAFSVGGGSDKVPNDLIDNTYFPSEDEIIIVTEAGQIVAPRGYNNTVARYGDIGTSTVYFQVPRYWHGEDLASDPALVSIYALYSFNGITSTQTDPLTKISKFISMDEEGQTLLYEWDIPDTITNNGARYTGNFTVGLSFVRSDGLKKWTTSPYTGMNIAPALIDSDEDPGAARTSSIDILAATKVDKIIDKTWQAYVVDGSGNTVAKPLAAEPTNGSIPLYNEGGILKTNAPEENLDAANKQYVDETSFKRPQNLSAWKILGIGDYNAETGEYTPTLYTRDPLGTGNAYVATFTSVSQEAVWVGKDSYLKYTLGGADPLYPAQYATKRYVDNKTRTLEQGLYSALGTQYIEVVDTSTEFSVPIPENALRVIYIESFGEVHFMNDSNEEIGSEPLNGIRIGGEYFGGETPKFVEMPEGATFIEPETLDPPEGTLYTQISGRKIIYQVKVGG